MDIRLRRRQKWIERVQGILDLQGKKVALPKADKPITPERLNAIELELWRATHGNKACRFDFDDWDFASRPGPAMLANPNQKLAAAKINESIDRHGLADVSPATRASMGTPVDDDTFLDLFR